MHHYKYNFYKNNLQIGIFSHFYSIKEAAEKFEVSINKSKYWFNQVADKKISKKKIPQWGGNHSKNDSKLKLILKIVSRILKYSGIFNFSLSDISNILLNKFQIQYSKSSLQRLMKKNDITFIKSNKVYKNKYKISNINYYNFYTN